jgi:hypothetical protein
LQFNQFGERGNMALAESLPNIQGLQQITIISSASFQTTTLALLLEGFRKNISLVRSSIHSIHFIFDSFDLPGSGRPGELAKNLKRSLQRYYRKKAINEAVLRYKNLT